MTSTVAVQVADIAPRNLAHFPMQNLEIGRKPSSFLGLRGGRARMCTCTCTRRGWESATRCGTAAPTAGSTGSQTSEQAPERLG